MIKFTAAQIALAREMKAAGIGYTLAPGTYVFTDHPELSRRPTPLQPGVFLVTWPEEFLKDIGGLDALAAHYCWMPTWEDGSAWLAGLGVPRKHLYYTVKEGVVFYQEEERTILYQEMRRMLDVVKAWDGEGAEERG